LLYLFKQNGMTAESIDLCENYENAVEGYKDKMQASLSEVRN